MNTQDVNILHRYG